MTHACPLPAQRVAERTSLRCISPSSSSSVSLGSAVGLPSSARAMSRSACVVRHACRWGRFLQATLTFPAHPLPSLANGHFHLVPPVPGPRLPNPAKPTSPRAALFPMTPFMFDSNFTSGLVTFHAFPSIFTVVGQFPFAGPSLEDVTGVLYWETRRQHEDALYAA